MATGENRNPYWWLKVETFVITNALRQYLETHTIPEEQAKYLAYVENKIITAIDREQIDNQGFARIHKTYWQDKMGSDYRANLDLLVSIGDIEIDPSYCFLSPDATPEERETFVPKCKGFKLTDKAIVSGTSRIDFKKKRVIPLKAMVQDASDPIAAYVRQCMEKLEVNPELPLPDDATRASIIKRHCEKMHYGAYSIRRGKSSGRLFHPVIEMPKEGRASLRHKSGEPIVDLDIATCHPKLLVKYFSDPKERAQYVRDIRLDIYSVICATNRKAVKERFCAYLTTRNRQAAWLKDSDVAKYFSQYPIFKWALDAGNGLAAELQRAESRLMVDALGAFCKANGLWFVTMHDGCLCLAKDAERIKTKIDALLFDAVGVSANVEIKLLSEVTTLPTLIKVVENKSTAQHEPQATAVTYVSVSDETLCKYWANVLTIQLDGKPSYFNKLSEGMRAVIKSDVARDRANIERQYRQDLLAVNARKSVRQLCPTCN